LIVKHFNCISMSPRWVEEPFDVGVDSGQAGVFDAAHFRDNLVVMGVERISKEAPICPEEPWYSICCDRTIGSPCGAGVVPHGAVSSSGFGDGSYRCWTAKDRDGQVVAVKISYLYEEELEDE
jgi:hypothetical protein